MPERQTARSADPMAGGATRFIDAVTTIVWWSIPTAAVGVILWLAYDAFRLSAEAGARSLCAALLPVLLGSYLRWVHGEWLRVLDRIPQAGLGLAAALGTIAVLTIISAGPSSHILPQFAISFAFCTMILARTDIEDRSVGDGPDRQLLNLFFGVAIGLAFYGLFRLNG